MTKGNTKRGFITPQPAAALAALDFAHAFDARGFLQEFEAIGGQVVTNGQSFAVIYPAETDVIPTALIEWGAVVEAAQERALYGA